VQPGLRLGVKDAADGRVDPDAGDAPGLDRGDHGVDRLRRRRRHEQDVRPGQHRVHRHLARGPAPPHPVHVQRVRHDQAPEAQLAAEHAREDRAGEGGRAPLAVRLERRDRQMGAHDPGHAGPDRGPERDQLHGVEPLPGREEVRHGQVGVHLGVAMPGEVLRHGEQPARPRAVDERRHPVRHRQRVRAVRPGVDHRVERVDVHVRHGRERHVHARGPGLLGRDPARLEGEGRRARRGQRHVHREDRGALEPGARAPLQVRGDQERDPGRPLELVQPLRRLPGIADADEQPADPLLRDERPGAPRLRAVQRAAGDPGHHHLRHLLAQTQPGQRALDPRLRRIGIRQGWRRG